MGITKNKDSEMIKWLAKQKFLFDYGLSFAATANAIGSNVLLMIVAEDKFKLWFHIKDMRILVSIFALSYVAFIWAVGYLLYRTKFMQQYYSSGNEHNDVLLRIEKYIKEHS